MTFLSREHDSNTEEGPPTYCRLRADRQPNMAWHRMEPKGRNEDDSTAELGTFPRSVPSTKRGWKEAVRTPIAASVVALALAGCWGPASATAFPQEHATSPPVQATSVTERSTAKAVRATSAPADPYAAAAADGSSATAASQKRRMSSIFPA